jgi:alginate O-acetyltransferase complex protein AlgJ
MIRKISTPTLANLDFAAYSANPIRYDHTAYKPKKPPQKLVLNDMTFGGVLNNAVHSIEETPLSNEEKQQPMAWAPLQNLLWSDLKIDAVAKIGSRIIAEKWSDPDIFQPYQNIAALYLHKDANATQIWAEVEFNTWVTFLSGFMDKDNDGFVEIYGRLNCDAVNRGTLDTLFMWVQNVYQKRVLTRAEILDWGQVLASYWYPTLNTDLVDVSQQSQWPTDETEKSVRKELKGTVIKNPTLVIRGNPQGKPLYNIFVVDELQEMKKAGQQTRQESVLNKSMDASVSVNFQENNERFLKEVKPFGDYALWHTKNVPLITLLDDRIYSLPPDQMAVKGEDGWLFFRKSFEYLMAGDMSKQAEDKNPLTHLVEFKKYLDAHNINLLFVPVPAKEEIYLDKLGINQADSTNLIINPYTRKILYDLQKAGIEVIDLLPHLLQAKKEDGKFSEPVFQKHDTHWTNRGLQIAAGLIADRIKQYQWYKDTTLQKNKYTLVDTTFERTGDIVERLPEQDKAQYKAVILKAQQVKNPDGTLYKGNPKDPILLIGDSYTGVFELIDCKSAGIGAHIAAKTGLGVDIVTGWGGGPLIRNKMLRMRKNDLDTKRVLVYIMTARDLNNYSQGWEKLKTE